MKVTSKVTINRKAIKQISAKSQTALGETADILEQLKQGFINMDK